MVICFGRVHFKQGKCHSLHVIIYEIEKQSDHTGLTGTVVTPLAIKLLGTGFTAQYRFPRRAGY